MSITELNGLANSRSAYLRSARHQPVQWHEWGSDAFDKAVLEDKPILLDIGAVWCHWCHVMDRESYEDPETARLINEHFIAVKVDRDERPDVDARYQAAVSAISGQGGWPLTAFLTPEGKPFFGGTYFPPTDGHGRPGLRRVLMTMAESFEKRRDEIFESASSVMAAIEHNESFDGSRKDPGPELVAKIIDSCLKQFDSRNGGFGAQPKFPHPGAIDLLLDEAARDDDGERAKASRLAALVTLEKMSKGGIYDHLAGGFHRYSVDERWVVPHFEKMSYDNSEILKNYVHAYQSTGEPECARIARETMRWIDEWMSDRELGGFYASQDADDSLEDDGDYFTWTRDEAAAVLSPEELTLVDAFFDIGEVGDMHHNPLKNTMHIDLPLATVAGKFKLPLDHATQVIETAKIKLYAARKLRRTPYIDKTIYVGWNAMMISAYLLAGRVLEERAAVLFALKSLDRMLSTPLGHVVAYGEGVEAGARVPAVLEDFLFTAHAALDAWEATGEMRYFRSALAIAEQTIADFYDSERGGFFDTPPNAGEKIGALSARRKPLQDSPTPAGNPVAALLLVRLAALTGREDFTAKARQTLECFAGVVEHFGLYAATFGIALRSLILPHVQVVVIGQDANAKDLLSTALKSFAISKAVISLNTRDEELPPSLAETISFLPPFEGSCAILCSGFTCQPPIFSADVLETTMRGSAN